MAKQTTSEKYINKMYDSQQKSTLQGLESTYKQNVNALNKTEKEIPQQYYEQKRQTEGNAAIQRKNMNEVFNANGLNTGAIGQANLAMSNQNTANLSALNKAQAGALADVSLKKANLQTEYQSAVQKAIADGDYNRSRDLYGAFQQEQQLQREKEQQTRAEAQAQVDALIKLGITPSDKLIEKSGYNKSYVTKYAAAMKKQIGNKGGGGGSRSSSKLSGTDDGKKTFDDGDAEKTKNKSSTDKNGTKYNSSVFSSSKEASQSLNNALYGASLPWRK